MLKKLLAPALIMALAGVANAQSGNPYAPRLADEPKKEEPKKDEGKDKDKSKDKDKKDSKKLEVGSKAPAISATKWVKGKEVKSFEKGKVYVVEFWATWCGPCIKNIPHLTEIQKTYSDITVIGMAASEQDKDSKKVEEFVKGKGDEMNYTVAFDNGSGKMSENWMRAAGQNGIPCAFVVDGEGKIAFIGHPGDSKFEETIKSLSKAKKDDKKKDEPKKEEPKKDEPKKDDKGKGKK